MARTTAEIKDGITSDYISHQTIIDLYGLVPGQSFAQQFSLVSIENIIFSIIAFALSVHESIVEKNAENSRPHNRAWYKNEAMRFLDGLELLWIDNQFKYNIDGITDVEERKIIDRCAVLESDDGELVFKVATEQVGILQPLSGAQLLRFKSYMDQIKDAGNRLRIINEEADLLNLNLTAYVDPLIIDLVTGELLNSETSVKPVEVAINEYLANLEFDGGFVRVFFQDALQKARGMKLPIINDLQWKYAAYPFVPVGEWKIPEAGYFKINPEDLIINYQAYDLAAN